MEEKSCKECGDTFLITSFHLYTFQKKTLIENESEGSNNPSLDPTPTVAYSSLESTFPPAENSVEVLSQIPTVEIICHLVWNNHYRVFGEWICINCHKIWLSSYTWIKLRKFIDKIPAENLNRADFYMQSCNECLLPGNRILKYEHLKEDMDSNHHKRNLCKKCLYGEICHKTGNYFG
ncbi:hypothetical protein RclHR1_06930006 [Rhizophagus clarus]|uniref:3CxxC-type domain-containing protein n=1 Tax=Rhizophagus clarus TaxID=94130 RepID=A0A2Z6SJT5_9GLOM|nr:hypothetical protein RclHR1_06930006 [Rhizophagus clarus]